MWFRCARQALLSIALMTESPMNVWKEGSFCVCVRAIRWQSSGSLSITFSVSHMGGEPSTSRSRPRCGSTMLEVRPSPYCSCHCIHSVWPCPRPPASEIASSTSSRSMSCSGPGRWSVIL